MKFLGSQTEFLERQHKIWVGEVEEVEDKEPGSLGDAAEARNSISLMRKIRQEFLAITQVWKDMICATREFSIN